MIGSGLKKLAKEHGMSVDKGVAYGSLGGFYATMSEGAGYKRITFATMIQDPVKKEKLMRALDGRNLKKEFRVTELRTSKRFIMVVFHDDPGTMKKIYAFLDLFLPLLAEADATGIGTCSECGLELTDGCWKLIDGTAYYMHRGCAEKVCRDIAAEEQTRREEDTGNYFTGFLGALLGSVMGAVLWAVILYFGYVASLVGLAIGWLAEKGYNLFKGKQGMGKIAILIIVIIIGVLLGNFGADVITLVQMIGAGELPGLAYGDIPALILVVLLEDPGYLTATLTNIGMGLLFAGLGVWGLLRRTNSEVADIKIVDLK
ncbi:MAG: hypothetical protein IKJ99_00525 [Oscillospiraceae bacterium]|nr:hypothetical protein [Oscillospiraceae bacterium]